MFSQYGAGSVNPAQIISLFEEEEQQRQVAALFHARLKAVETPAEKEKAVNETLRRVKENSLQQKSARLELTDMAGLQQLIAEKKQLEKLYISFV